MSYRVAVFHCHLVDFTWDVARPQWDGVFEERVETSYGPGPPYGSWASHGSHGRWSYREICVWGGSSPVTGFMVSVETSQIQIGSTTIVLLACRAYSKRSTPVDHSDGHLYVLNDFPFQTSGSVAVTSLVISRLVPRRRPIHVGHVMGLGGILGRVRVRAIHGRT